MPDTLYDRYGNRLTAATSTSTSHQSHAQDLADIERTTANATSGGLYLDTSKKCNALTLDYKSFAAGKSFDATSAPYDYHGQADEDILIIMNDGYEFYQSAFQNFDRWYQVNLVNDEVDTRSYVFILRPDLYLIDEDATQSDPTQTRFHLSRESRVAYDPFFRYMWSNHSVILRGLTAEFGRGSVGASAVATSGLGNSNYGGDVRDLNGNILAQHAFVPFLVGRTESLQIPDYTIKTFNLVQPYSKYTIPFSTSAQESQTGGTFDVTFKEYYGLRLHKYFYAWLYYMDGVMRNRFKPKDKYITYNAFDYVTSIYHIVCDATATNIMWWSKYTGCFPTSVPNSDFSFNRQGKTENTLTIPFTYFMHEAMNPDILTDFNYNSLGYYYMRSAVGARLPKAAVYNADYGILGSSTVGRPFITTSGGDYFSPQLHWMPAEGYSQLMQTS